MELSRCWGRKWCTLSKGQWLCNSSMLSLYYRRNSHWQTKFFRGISPSLQTELCLKATTWTLLEHKAIGARNGKDIGHDFYLHTGYSLWFLFEQLPFKQWFTYPTKWFPNGVRKSSNMDFSKSHWTSTSSIFLTILLSCHPARIMLVALEYTLNK